jgi:hypothetical protein
MKNLILLLSLVFLIGCTPNIKIHYNIYNVEVPDSLRTIPTFVELRILEDNRAANEENSLLFKRAVMGKVDGKKMCVNSERHYKKEPVVNQISKLIADHFNHARLFHHTFHKYSSLCNYYLTGVLNSFYSEQEFSYSKVVGQSFGIIGFLATDKIKTPGRVVIEIADLKLYYKDGTLVKDFGSFHKEYKDDFLVDANCFCVYYNANDMLKEFNTHLIEKIRNEMADLQLK